MGAVLTDVLKPICTGLVLLKIRFKIGRDKNVLMEGRPTGQLACWYGGLAVGCLQ